MRWRGRSRGGRSPEVVHGLRQGLADPICEHRLERWPRSRRWRELFAGARKSLRYPGGVRWRRDRCRRPRWRCRCHPYQTFVCYRFHPSSRHRHWGWQRGRTCGCGLRTAATHTGACSTVGGLNPTLCECDCASGIKKPRQLCVNFANTTRSLADRCATAELRRAWQGQTLHSAHPATA